MLTPALAELIGDTYEAAATSDRWPIFLAHLAALIPDSFVLLGIIDREARFSQSIGMRGLPDASVGAYRQNFMRLNPWIGGLLSAPLGQPVAVRPLADDAAVQRGPFVQDWLRHQPGQHPASLLAPLDTGRRLCLTVVHADRRAPPNAVLDAVAPHFVRAAQLMRLRAQEASRHAATGAVLDMLSMAVIYADGDGRMVGANAMAEMVLRSNDGIGCGRDGRLAALRPSDTEHLRRAIRGAARTASGQPGSSGGVLRLPRRGDAPPIAALVAPLPAAGLAVVLVKRPEDDRLDPVALAVLHDLTPSETRLALLIVEGASLIDAAARSGVTLATAQGQMKAVLHKSATRNQADFVRVAMRGRLALR